MTDEKPVVSVDHEGKPFEIPPGMEHAVDSEVFHTKQDLQDFYECLDRALEKARR